MEWITTIKKAIQYMEDNLLTVNSIEEVAKASCISTIYLQQGFTIITGVSLGEYIRNRRLYKAAIELTKTDSKIIDIAFKYGYETPESFTKAFTRFHDATPLAVKKNKNLVKTFLPFQVNIVVQGGSKMNYVVEKTNSIKLVGFAKNFNNDAGFTEVPLFWDEYYVQFNRVYNTPNLQDKDLSVLERAVIQNKIGEYGICLDDIGIEGKFHYLIAGELDENSQIAKEYEATGKLPEGLEIYELPSLTWAKFTSVGKIPECMQITYNQFWNEWLPGNEKYELAGQLNVEHYTKQGEGEIWMPVKEK